MENWLLDDLNNFILNLVNTKPGNYDRFAVERKSGNTFGVFGQTASYFWVGQFGRLQSSDVTAKLELFDGVTLQFAVPLTDLLVNRLTTAPLGRRTQLQVRHLPHLTILTERHTAHVDNVAVGSKVS